MGPISFKRSWRLAVAAVACAAGSAAAQRGAIDLRHQWDAGDVSRFRMTEEMVQQISTAGDEQARWTREIEYTERVVEVNPAGAATVERTIDAVRIDANTGRIGGRAFWDSRTGRGDRENPVVRPFASWLGKTIRFTVDAEGHVSDVSGAEGLWVSTLTPVLEELLDNGVRTTAPRLQTKPPTPAPADNERFARQLEQGLKQIPGRSVRPRETWSTSIEHQTAIGVIRSETTNTFRRVRRTRSGPVARITFKGSLSVGPADGGPGQMLEEMTGLAIRMTDSSIQGETLFDYEAGQVARSEIVMRLSWSIEVGDLQTRGRGGPELGQTMHQRAVLERIED